MGTDWEKTPSGIVGRWYIMKKRYKVLIIILIILVIIAVGMKVAYDVYIPKLVDSVIENNIDKIFNDETISKELDKILANNPLGGNNSPGEENLTVETLEPTNGQENNTDSLKPGESSSPSSKPSDPKLTAGKQPETVGDISRKTYNNYTTVQLQEAYSKTTAGEKSAIFSIARSCVPASELPKMIELYRQDPSAAAMYGYQFVTSDAKSQVFSIIAKYLE